MTPKQARFVEEYLVDLNATRAAIRAGYSAKTASVQGFWLLREPKVQSAIADRQARALSRIEISREMIQAEQAKIAFANMLDYTRIQDGNLVHDFSTLTRDQAAAIQELNTEVEVDLGDAGDGEGKRPAVRIVKTKFKLGDKLRALELLGRPLGLSNVNLKVTVESVPLDLSALGPEQLALIRQAIALMRPPTMIEGEATDETEPE